MSAFYSTGPLPELHENCPATTTCLGCGREICQACEPSTSGELCARCYWIEDPGTPDLLGGGRA